MDLSKFVVVLMQRFTNKKQYDSYLKIDKSVPGPGNII